MITVLPYDSKLKNLARENRKISTRAESLLWNRLRRKQILGHTFLRQRPILNYIVDFYCPDAKLAIEIDGSSHDLKEVKDIKRQDDLEKAGIIFLRFTNKEIEENPDGAAIVILKWMQEYR